MRIGKDYYYYFLLNDVDIDWWLDWLICDECQIFGYETLEGGW